MYITLTVSTPADKNDIQIDNRQKISAAAEILRSTNKSMFGPSDYYLSKMQKRMISSHNTFLQEEIQSGDELTLISAKESIGND